MFSAMASASLVMKNRTIEVKIENCPLCAKSHSHILLLDEEPVLSITVAASLSQRSQQFDVYLTCPNKNDTFKATISLTPLPGTSIEKVLERR